MVTAMIDHDFSAHRAVFCDSMQAIEWARCRGLPNDAVIYSSSPAVIIANSNAIDIERRLASGLGRRFLIGMNDFVHDVFTNLVRDEPFAGAAHSAAHGVFGQQCLMHKALTLRHEDLISKRLIIETTTDDAVAESILKSFWPELLAKNVNCTTVTCSVRLPTLGRSLGGRLPNLMTRIQSLRPRRALYRGLVSRVGRKFVPSLRPYCVLIARDSNELLRDTAVALALSGHKLLALDALRPEPSCLDEPSRERISTAIRSAFEQTLAGLFTPLLIDTLMAAVAVAGIQEAGRAATAKNSWCRTFREYGSNRKGPGRALMLHGGPMGGAGAGLYAAARECDIPLIAFQHGIRREIADWPIDARILNESNFADLLICYNRHAADNTWRLEPLRGRPSSSNRLAE